MHFIECCRGRYLPIVSDPTALVVRSRMAEASSGGAGQCSVSSGKQQRAERDDLERAGQHEREGSQVARGHGGESTSRSDHRKNQGRQGGGKGRKHWPGSHKPYRQWDNSGQHLYTEGRYNHSSKVETMTTDEKSLQQSKVDRKYASEPPAKQKESSERSRSQQSGYPGSRERLGTKGLEVEGSLGGRDATEKGKSSKRDHGQQRYRHGKEWSPQLRRKVKQETSREELQKAKSESSVDQSDKRPESKGTQLHRESPISRGSLISEETSNRDRRTDESVRDNHGRRSNDSRASRSGRRPRHYDQYQYKPRHHGRVDERRYYSQEGGKPARKQEKGRESSYEKRRPNPSVDSQSGSSVFQETRVKFEEAPSTAELLQHTEHEYSNEQSSTGASKSESQSKLDTVMEQRHKQETDLPFNSNERRPHPSTPKHQPGDSKGDGGDDGSALPPPTNHNYTTGSVSPARHQKQQLNAKPRPRPPNPKARGRKVVPTVQSDELAQQLMAGTYECMVCCDRVRSRDQVWACGNCYHVFHLKCISKWATSPAAALDEGV